MNECTSFWGHDFIWLTLSENAINEGDLKQMCKRCGLVQTVKFSDGGDRLVYNDIGYSENKDEVIAYWSNLKVEEEQSASRVKSARARTARETIIPTSELVLKITNKEVDSQ